MPISQVGRTVKRLGLKNGSCEGLQYEAHAMSVCVVDANSILRYADTRRGIAIATLPKFCRHNVCLWGTGIQRRHLWQSVGTGTGI